MHLLHGLNHKHLFSLCRSATANASRYCAAITSPARSLRCTDSTTSVSENTETPTSGSISP